MGEARMFMERLGHVWSRQVAHDGLIAPAALLRDLGQQGKPTEHESNAGRWCTHHARHGISEVIGAGGRGGLCGWCYSFQAEHAAKLPPIDLLTAKAEGRRISQAMVRAALVGPSSVHEGKRKAKK